MSKYLVICEFCGVSFETNSEMDVCKSCVTNHTQRNKASLSERAIEKRNIAKMFGGKALTGTVKQKEWAEKIRAEKLAALSEDEAIKICTAFWINNRNKTFTFDDAVETIEQLRELNDKHYNTLARTCSTASKNAARKEIIEFYKNCNVVLDGEFPTFKLQTILASI